MAGLVPFNKNKSLFNSNMLDDFFGDFLPTRFFSNDTFKVDVSENDKSYLVEAELPGIKKEEVNLSLDDDRLTISVEREEKTEDKKGSYIHKERRYGSMQRSIYLQDIANEGIDAKFENGLLKIEIPKQDKKDNSRRIEIK